MSRRRGKGLSPSLFPFLAVLVCTLGTLILLLALVAQNATEAAEQRARAEAAESAKQLAEASVDQPARLSAESVQSLLREEQFRVEQLVAVRDQQTGDLEQRRDQLTHLEQHMQRLRDQLRQISSEVEQTLSDNSDTKIDEQQIAVLREQIEQQQAIVEQLRESAQDQTPRFIIVPHKGPNGTDRRPVYLECTAQGVTVWPEGSTITLEQLESSSPAANPLDSALRTVRMYAMKYYGDAAPPYPLLVVRPEGIQAYAAARQAMSDWDDQFGYELVPSDLKLAFKQPDAQLKERVDVAIRQAAAKQIAQQRIALYGNTRGGYAGTAVRGGRLPVLSAAALDRAGRRSGFASRDENGFERRGYGSFDHTGGSNSTTNSFSTVGSGVRGGQNHAGYGQNNDNYGSGTGGANAGQPAIDPATMRKLDDQMRSAAAELQQQRGNGYDATGSFADSTASPNKDPLALTDPRSGLHPPGNGSAIGAGQPTSAQQPSNETTAAQNEIDGKPANPNSATTPEGSPQQDRFSGQDRFNPSDSDNRGRSDAGSSAQQQAASSGGSHTRPSHATSPSQTPSNGMQSFSSVSPAARPNTAGQQPSQRGSSASSQPSSRTPPSMQQTSSPTLSRSGKQWALPDHMRGVGGNSIVRMIRAQCDGDQFVLLGSGDAPTEVFGLSSGQVDEATLRIATAIHDRIDRWGPALPGGRWQPTLEVVVRPGGEARFHQLRAQLANSGIDVVGRAAQ